MIKASLFRIITLIAFLLSGLTAGAAAGSTNDTGQAALKIAQESSQEQSGGMSMMGQEMMDQGMASGMMRPGMMNGMPMMRMRGNMMKVMFAIADIDGDGGLSFEEVTTIHRRIFDKVDTNKDGKVTIEEFQTFMGN